MNKFIYINKKIILILLNTILIMLYYHINFIMIIPLLVAFSFSNPILTIISSLELNSHQHNCYYQNPRNAKIVNSAVNGLTFTDPILTFEYEQTQQPDNPNNHTCHSCPTDQIHSILTLSKNVAKTHHTTLMNRVQTS